MVNPMLLLSGVGMVLVALVSSMYWWRKKSVSINFFLFGGIVWGIAIGVKLAMDLILTPKLNDFLLKNYPISTVVILIGMYVGLRTGVFESGFTYILALKTKLKNASFDEAIAFGIGFGATEALILGILSFVNLLAFLIKPDLIETIPPEQKIQVVKQLEMPTVVVLAPILERIFTLLGHVFASILVLYAAAKEKPKYFIYSLIYKSPIDATIPWLNQNIEKTVKGIFLMEIPVFMFGLIGVLGIYWIWKKWR